MSKQYIGGIVTGLLIAFSMLLGFALARIETNLFAQQSTPTPPPSVTPFILPSDTRIPLSPLPTLTPSQTLKPPPTLEPPTATVRASETPSRTPTPPDDANLAVVVAPQGIQGLTTPTSIVPDGCVKREDWVLRYTVQAGDALSTIATRYGTITSELVLGNCLADADKIVAGQVLHVPGESQPVQPQYECIGWEVLTPFDHAYAIDPDETLTFNWRGPVAERYLLRINRPDGTTYEELVDRRQNIEVYLPEAVPMAGNFEWFVFPLGLDFLQIPCREGGPWYFHKEQSIALTWTPMPTSTSTDTPEPWEQTATARAGD